MAEVADIERAILRELVRIGPCAFDDLALTLCEYSWNQVFSAVDRLSRQGRLALRHPGRFGVVVQIRGQEVSSPSNS
ncbi:MAG: hypothetical protein ACREJ6_08350 [Candidatus Methylomirabilis sp.]